MNNGPKLFRLRRRDIAYIASLSVVQALTMIAFIITMSRLIDLVELAGVSGVTIDLVGPVLIMVTAALLHGGLTSVLFSASEKVGYRIVQDLRMQMHSHLQGMQPRQIQSRSRGGLLLRFTGDLSMLRTWISRGFLGSIGAATYFVVITSVMIYVSPWLALAMIAVVAIGSALSLVLGDPMRRATRAMRRRRSLLTSNIDEQIHALPVVQVNGRSAGEHSRLSRQNDSLTRALMRVADLRGHLRGIADGTALLAVVAVLAVGLSEVYSGAVSLGTVIALMAVSRQMTTQVRTFGLAHDYWQRSRVSVRKLDDFLRSSTTELAPQGADRLRVRKGQIDFEAVTVPGALSDFSATAEPGLLIAITGPNGAGKSTVLGLVARTVGQASGSVTVDGQPLGSVSPASTYRRIGMVAPDLPLMRGTVRRNLTYRMPNATPAEIDRVILNTSLDEVLDDLPGGITSWVTEAGKNLSVGQRQRIALGRALMGNPSLLLLDEPTANLDARGKEAFRRTLAHFQGTVLLVTHDRTELELADEVWVMADGRLIEAVPGVEYRQRTWSTDEGSPSWA